MLGSWIVVWEVYPVWGQIDGINKGNLDFQ